jgi:transcriptional regulator with XRE-family HTH domain
VPEVRGSTGSPTVRRRELGALLRALRSARALTVDQVASELMCSPSKISRMETGQRGTTLRDVRDLCRIYGVTDDAQVGRLMNLARGGKEQGWWQPYDLEFSTYIDLETAAVALNCYMSSVVPGILQTPEYAQAMHLAGFQGYSDDEIDKHVEVRMRRQARLVSELPLRLAVVLDEAVLRRVVGGPSVMGAQLDRLVEVSRLPHIDIQVIPYEVGAHPAMESNFNILEFDSSSLNVVYVEGLVGWIYLHKQQDIRRYWMVFERLREIALTPQESSEMIAKIAALYRGAADVG